MSRLKELNWAYAKEDNCIPVEYYTPTGQLLKGTVQRVDDDVAIIVTNFVDQGIRARINVKGFAGPANPEEWCLARTAKAMFDALGNPAVSEFAEKKAQIVKLSWKALDEFVKPKFALISEWPGVDTMDIAGFIQFPAGNAQRCGFLIYSTTNLKPTFFHDLPEKAILEYFE